MYLVMNNFSKALSRSSYSALDLLARSAAFLLFRVFRLRRSLVLNNIETVFGDSKSSKEKEEIAYLSYYHFICTALEFLSDRNGEISMSTKFEGLNYLNHALNQKKGVYIVCCHLGNWEVMGGAITNQIKPAHIIVKQVGSKGMNEFVVQQRKQIGFNCIEKGKKGSAYKSMIEVLNRGEIIGFAMDQARPNEPRLPFFGKNAKTNTSLAAIWRKHPAPLIPAFIERVAFGKHIVHVLPEINLHSSASTEETIKAEIISHTKTITKEVENMIKLAPEQYFWLHNRWK